MTERQIGTKGNCRMMSNSFLPISLLPVTCAAGWVSDHPPVSSALPGAHPPRLRMYPHLPPSPDLPNTLGKSPPDTAPIHGLSFQSPPPSGQGRLSLLVPSKQRDANSFPLSLVPTHFTPLLVPSPAYTCVNDPFITFSPAKPFHGLI